MSKTNGKGFAVGAVVGGLLGAVTALLLAPKTGKELRSDVAEQYGKISDKTVEIAGTVSTKSQEIAGTVSAKTQVIAGTVSTKSKEIAKTVSEHTGVIVGKAKETAGVVAEEVKAWKESRKVSSVSDEPVVEAAEAVEEELVKQ